MSNHLEVSLSLRLRSHDYSKPEITQTYRFATLEEAILKWREVKRREANRRKLIDRAYIISAAYAGYTTTGKVYGGLLDGYLTSEKLDDFFHEEIIFSCRARGEQIPAYEDRAEKVQEWRKSIAPKPKP